jgi:hypothetical protein
MLVVGALGGIATISAIAFASFLQYAGTDSELIVFAVLCGMGCVLPFAYWISSAAYRIGGGRNLIRIHDDRIEVPSTRARQPLVFRREGLVVKSRVVRVRLRLGAELHRGMLIELRSPRSHRSISTLVLEDPVDRQPLLEDLQRFVAGEVALGRVGHETKPRTEYDDRLDRELAGIE